MRDRIIIAGFGGQGVMLMGQLLAYAATEKELNTTWVPSYGPETRGGTANCQVIISDGDIYSPIFTACEYGLILNGPSLDKFEHEIIPDGKIFINEDMVAKHVKRTDIKEYRIPANKLAIEIGLEKAANMVMLGAFVENVHDFFITDDILNVLKEKFGEEKAHLIEVNRKALEAGANYVRTLK